MRAIIDQDVCVGCGLCPETCPDVFRMEDDKAVVCTDPVPQGLEVLARQAAEECPVEAIEIEA
jgi:ferredoxin